MLHEKQGTPCLISRVFLVMGVCGSGKSTIAQGLAERFSGTFIEADDFHPAENVALMSAGIPLDDERRGVWLDIVCKQAYLALEQDAPQPPIVFIACSALKSRYRAFIRQQLGNVVVLHLDGDQAVIHERMSKRANHFMPVTLLDSQLRDLERPTAADLPWYRLDLYSSPESLLREAGKIIVRHLPAMNPQAAE